MLEAQQRCYASKTGIRLAQAPCSCGEKFLVYFLND